MLRVARLAAVAVALLGALLAPVLPTWGAPKWLPKPPNVRSATAKPGRSSIHRYAAGLGVAASAHRVVEAEVVRVVDGDTIRVRLGDRIEKVRYIGVNTPELHHPQRGPGRDIDPGGREAADVNRELVWGLASGKHVRLEFDVRERDRYGRLLAYVWIDDVMVNAELVRRGYAQVMTVPPNVRYQSLFLSLERTARETGRGLWRGA